MSFNYDVGSVYNLTLYPSAVLQRTFNNVKILGELNFEILDDKASVKITHSQIYNVLPLGVNENAELLTYLKVKLEDGSIVTLAKDWISNQVLVERKKLTIVVDNFDVSKLQELKDCFIQLGIIYKITLQ